VTMQKGKVRLIRNDDVLKVKERLFRIPDDNTLYVAQVSLHKKPSPLFPHKKELWLGYYTSMGGQQMGLGFFRNVKQVPKKFRPAFTGLDIKVGHKGRR